MKRDDGKPQSMSDTILVNNNNNENKKCPVLENYIPPTPPYLRVCFFRYLSIHFKTASMQTLNDYADTF